MNSGIGTERAKELESLSVTARAADSDTASQVLPQRRVARLAVRVCLTVGLLYGCYLVARRVPASLSARLSGIEFPRTPWSRRGRFWGDYTTTIDSNALRGAADEVQHK